MTMAAELLINSFTHNCISTAHLTTSPLTEVQSTDWAWKIRAQLDREFNSRSLLPPRDSELNFQFERNSSLQMAARFSTVKCALFAVLALSLQNLPVYAADPGITTDFVVPAGVNASSLDGSFFTSTLLREVKIAEGPAATVTPVNSKAFPALEGLGVSFALLQFPPRTLNSPHTHPRASEIVYIIEGELSVGFIDTTNKLFTQTLRRGDLFVFPVGLVHFQINWDSKQTAKAVGAFGSSNPGLIRLRNNLFQSGISDAVLQKSFGVSADIVSKLKSVSM